LEGGMTSDQDWLAYKPVPFGHKPGEKCKNPLCEIATVRLRIEASLPRELTDRWTKQTREAK
jgi:hypothetical protein